MSQIVRSSFNAFSFPLLVCVPLCAASWGLRMGYDHTLVIGVCVGVSLLVQLGWEIGRPHREDWQSRRRLGADLGFVLLAGVTATALDVGAATGLYWVGSQLTTWFGGSLWPTGWPLLAQLGLAILVGDLGHYAAHRALHDVPALFRFHRLHHRPDHVYALNFFRMHPVEIAFKTLANVTPMILLGVPTEVMAVWSVVSGVAAGSVNHANIEMTTTWLDHFLSTPRMHRFHHSVEPAQGRCNLGNITLLYDRLFGTYYNPGAGREVARVGLVEGRVSDVARAR